MTALSLPSAALFLLMLFPGLVSAHVYRLIMPARELKWSEASFEALFYSAINFVLGLPILWWLLLGYAWAVNPGRYVLAAVLVMLVLPAVTPVVLVKLFKSSRLATRIQVEAVHHVDADGKVGEVVPNSRGVLLRRDQYRYIEVFDLPAQEATE